MAITSQGLNKFIAAVTAPTQHNRLHGPLSMINIAEIIETE